MQLAGTQSSPAVNAKAEFPAKLPRPRRPSQGEARRGKRASVLAAFKFRSTGNLHPNASTCCFLKGTGVNKGIFILLHEKHHPPLLYSRKRNIFQLISSEALMPYSTGYSTADGSSSDGADSRGQLRAPGAARRALGCARAKCPCPYQAQLTALQASAEERESPLLLKHHFYSGSE